MGGSLLVIILVLMPFLAICSGGGSDSSGGFGDSTPSATATATVGDSTPSATATAIATATATATATAAMLTPQQRTASLDAIHTKLASLPGIDIAAENKTLAQFIESRPEFAASGTTDGDLTVWGKWSDGVIYLIVRNREISGHTVVTSNVIAAAASKVALQTGASHASNLIQPSSKVSLAHEHLVANADAPEDGFPSNLPASNRVRLLSAMGPGFADIRPTLRDYFLHQQYEEVHADATVDGLKTVGGDGVLYFTTHGGDGSGTYALATATERTELNEATYQQDLHPIIMVNPDGSAEKVDPRLVIMEACFDGEIGCSISHPSAYERHYGITSQFVKKYWGTFADYSLVFLDACNSNSGDSADLVKALVDKNASVVMGWTGEVKDAVGAGSALYVFDRLLGANDFRPQKSKTGFNQRPFDWISVLDDCKKNGGLCSSLGHLLVVDEAIPGCLASGKCDQTFGLLAPSIREMWVYESPTPGTGRNGDMLLIAGLFGLDPGHGSFDPARGVSIGGTEVPVLVWNPRMLIVALPHSGAGVAGDVIVRVHDHTSNTAQLTEWKVPFTFKLVDFQQLGQTVTFNADFRADVRKTVQVIGQAPVEPTWVLQVPSDFPMPALPLTAKIWNAILDSNGAYQCYGKATVTANGHTTTELWKDSGSISYTAGDQFRSPLEVRDSTRLVLTLKDWLKTCASTLDGRRSSVDVLRPGEVEPTGGYPFDGTIVMLLNDKGVISKNPPDDQHPDSHHTGSHSPLGGDATVPDSLSWPETPPVAGAPDPNSAR